MPNTGSEYRLSSEENRQYFQKKILSKLKDDFNFSKQENPKAYFTAGIPGAGKSNLVEVWKKINPDIIIIDADELRKKHPKAKEIQDKFGSQAASITHPDATRWVGELKKEAEKHKANYIMDGSLRNPDSAERKIQSALKDGYSVEVTMVAVNKYESLQGIYARYANQYESSPKTARFVDPKLIDDAHLSIRDSVAVIDKLEIKHFKIVDRSMETVFDSSKDIKGTAKEKLEEHTDLKNWSHEKINKLQDNWNKVIIKLKEVNVPSNIIESAKATQTSLNTEIKDIQKAKLYEKVKAFKKSHPEKTKDIQKSKGLER